MGCACGANVQYTVDHRGERIIIGGATGGFKNFQEQVEQKIPELHWTAYKFKTNDAQKEYVTSTESLRIATQRNKNKLDLMVEVQHDYQFKRPRLEDMSYAVVKIKHNDEQRVVATGVVVGKKYVITGFAGPGKIAGPDDLSEYSIITRESDQKNRGSSKLSPKQNGAWILLGGLGIVIFELQTPWEHSCTLSPNEILSDEVDGCIMYYKTKNPKLDANENFRLKKYKLDDSFFSHIGKWKQNTGTEGAPIFVNFAQGGDDWQLSAIHWVPKSQIEGDAQNLATKSTAIIASLGDFGKTSNSSEAKTCITQIVGAPVVRTAPVARAPDPPPVVIQQRSVAPAAPQRPSSSQSTISSFEKKSVHVKQGQVSEYEAGTHTKFVIATNVNMGEGFCVSCSPTGCFITGGENGQKVMMWTGFQLIELPQMKNRHQYHCAILFNDAVYVISGKHTDAVEAMDLTDRAWVDKGRLTTPRAYASVAFAQGKLFVLGGQDASGQFLDTIESYDGTSWKLFGGFKLPCPLASLGAISVNPNKLVIYGGRSEGQVQGERKTSYYLNFLKNITKEGKAFQQGGNFSQYQFTMNDDEAVSFSEDGELIRYNFASKKFYHLIVGIKNK